MTQLIRKAVFPVAGLGSRFLPATKANPKEMLPIVDKPLIQYAVEEAINAGITEMIFITSSSKHAIEDHFDLNYELESRLAKQNKHELLEVTRNIIPSGINCIYLRQPEPLGLGDAVLKAKTVVGNEPFAVLLADDLFDCPSQNCMQQLIDVFNETNSSLVAVEKVHASQIHKYGVVALEQANPGYSPIKGVVEKPSYENAPSNFGVAGRYILTPAIFDFLCDLQKGTGGEFQLTDAISLLLSKEKVHAVEFNGKRYDCGSKLGYLKATVNTALKHPELKNSFEDFLQELIVARESECEY